MWKPQPVYVRRAIDRARDLARERALAPAVIYSLLAVAEAARIARIEDAKRIGYSQARWSSAIDDLWRKLDLFAMPPGFAPLPGEPRDASDPTDEGPLT